MGGSLSWQVEAIEHRKVLVLIPSWRTEGPPLGMGDALNDAMARDHNVGTPQHRTAPHSTCTRNGMNGTHGGTVCHGQRA